MIITCASCLTKFNLDDSRIPSKGAKVRCSRCKHTFYVVPPPETKEEVMENFESFAKYHEDRIPPAEEAPKKVSPKAERQESIPLPTGEERPSPPPESAASPEATAPFESMEEEEPFPFGEKALRETEKKEKAEVKPSKPKGFARSRERRRLSPLLAIPVIVVLLIFGLFYLWTAFGSGGKLSPYLEGPVQKMKGIWSSLWGIEKEGLSVGDLTGYEEKTGDLSLFVIEGKVSNQSRFTKKFIRVKVILFDSDKLKMAEKEAFCGPILSRQDVKNQPPAFFKGDMVIKPQTEKEMLVPSSTVAPFMVIFRDPLSQAKEFKVEIEEAPNL